MTEGLGPTSPYAKGGIKANIAAIHNKTIRNFFFILIPSSTVTIPTKA